LLEFPAECDTRFPRQLDVGDHQIHLGNMFRMYSQSDPCSRGGGRSKGSSEGGNRERLKQGGANPSKNRRDLKKRIPPEIGGRRKKMAPRKTRGATCTE
jgi:hypothetical protein